MNDKELIKLFLDEMNKDIINVNDKISKLLDINISNHRRQDLYKDKIFNWNHLFNDPTSKSPSDETVWSASIAYFIDDEMRDKIKKFLFKRL